MDVDGAAQRIAGPFSDGGRQLGPIEHAARPLGQRPQDLELAGGQIDRGSVEPGLHRAAVQHQRAEAEHAVGHGALAHPPQDGR